MTRTPSSPSGYAGRCLAGLPWHAHSPSLLEYPPPPKQAVWEHRSVFLGFDGTAWRIGLANDPWGVRRFKTAVEAAQLVAECFRQAVEGAL